MRLTDAALDRAGDPAGERGGGTDVLSFVASDGRRVVFRPGVSATLDGKPLDARSWPLHASPFLAKRPDGSWRFQRGEVAYRFAPLSPLPSSASAGGG